MFCPRSGGKFLPLALVSLVCACAGDAPNTSRPDVVLVVVDTLRSDRLACYGYPRNTSPVIDSLGAQGVIFEDSTCQWPWTLPSMVSLFEGRYITDYRDKLDDDVPTLPELFQAAGYRTVGIVANCIVDEGQGFARGFDRFDCVSCWDAEGKKNPSQRDVEELRKVTRENVAPALALDARGERPPLFLYLHAYDPHDPYALHDQYREQLPNDAPLPVVPEDYWSTNLARLQPDLGAEERQKVVLNLIRQRGRYDQEVRAFDAGLGLILEDLKSLGLSSNALHALVADHGEGLWEHLANMGPAQLAAAAPQQIFYQIHGGNGYQAVMATPFLMWGGGIPKGLRFTAAVENIDLVPTLLELAKIEAPEGLDGRSLLRLFEGTPKDWREFVYCYGSHNISIRHPQSGFKVIIPSGKSIESGRQIELYNVIQDPHERNNLVDSQAAELKRLLEQYPVWMDANPTIPSTKNARHGDQHEQDRALLRDKLRSLGYTDTETGGGDF